MKRLLSDAQREQHKERCRAWRALNRELIKEYDRTRNTARSEQNKERSRVYRTENRERIREYERLRNAARRVKRVANVTS